MAKKELIKLVHAVVIDRINDEVIMCVVGKNRRDVVRNLILCGIGNSYPYRDMKIVYDADMFTNGKLVAKLKTEEISWKEWEAPIDKIENVAELGEKAVEALKKEIADSDKNKQKMVDNIVKEEVKTDMLDDASETD